ncbi:hypothetical protein TNCV_4466111 [Trichonephila clavipes]|nr:hypothetical protein TNCV_4466111 [Trichonephila clavipes]
MYSVFVACGYSKQPLNCKSSSEVGEKARKDEFCVSMYDTVNQVVKSRVHQSDGNRNTSGLLEKFAGPQIYQLEYTYSSR